MITHEPECVELKRRGAEYVAQMLSGKSRHEEMEFWRKRTERLNLSHNKARRLRTVRSGSVVLGIFDRV